MKLTVALTGHRPDKLGGYDLNTPYYDVLENKLAQLLLEYLKMYDYVEAHSGMALGADTVWTKVILKLRDQYPDRITFVADIPNYNQSNRWFAKKDVNFWKHAIEEADVVNTWDEGSKSYAHALQLRNIGMINPVDVLISVYDGTPGGTANAVKYARSKNKTIVQINPTDIPKAVITKEKLKHTVFHND